MKALLLISGSLRTFRENIHRLPPEYDIAVYVSRDDTDTYLNIESVKALLDEPRIKTLLIEPIPADLTDNTSKQWYKLWRLWNAVPKTYATYIRIRPDVFIVDPQELCRAVEENLYLTIPAGNDRDGINDQVAIGTFDAMSHYCGVFLTLPAYPNHTSESILAHHLEAITVHRASIDYKLVLSSAKVIAIAGDSGSGKSTLCKLIRPLFLFDKVLEFETDRYHKWERGDAHWESTTHLNPEANYLEKLENDTFNLKLGTSVLAVDYDHTTGTFTPPKTIEPKDNILLCGLHTLYSKQLRTLSDLKIYVDTSEELKRQWKIQRDTQERGQASASVLAKIESRKVDYEAHIVPQRTHADLIIQFHEQGLTLMSSHREWLSGLPGEYSSGRVTFTDPSVDVRKQVYEFLWSLDLPPIEAKPGYDGVLQFTVLRALYTKHG